MEAENTQAYYDTATITIMKKFIVQAQLISPILHWQRKKLYKLETRMFRNWMGKGLER
jgi:hypothetical protein